MPSTPTIIVDFDDTLHDTTQLKHDMITACEDLAISVEVFQHTYTPLHDHYTIAQHTQAMSDSTGIDAQLIYTHLKPLLSIAAFHTRIFAGAKGFLRSLHTTPFNGYTKIMVSKGSPEMQTLKIQSSDLSHFFEQVFIVPDKIDFLHENPDFQQGFFINDKIAENTAIQNRFALLDVITFQPGYTRGTPDFTDFDRLYQYLQSRQIR